MGEFERIAVSTLEKEVRKNIYGAISCKLKDNTVIVFITDSDGYKWKYTTRNFLTSIASGVPIPRIADMIVKSFTKDILSKFIIQSKKH